MLGGQWSGAGPSGQGEVVCSMHGDSVGVCTHFKSSFTHTPIHHTRNMRTHHTPPHHDAFFFTTLRYHRMGLGLQVGLKGMSSMLLVLNKELLEGLKAVVTPLYFCRP